jgi:4-amino-4-deoxy-L-arabinose transferase-like glycosyltransferase
VVGSGRGTKAVRDELKPIAWRGLTGIAGALAALLIAVSGRYGFHRDELYFLAAGRHPAWGYADQPPLIPLLARAVSVIAPDSLVLHRLPAAVAAAGIVVLAGLMTRALGGGRTAELISAGCVAVAPMVIGAGHLFGTTIFDAFVWALVCMLVIWLCRGAHPRNWLLVGLVVGIGLLIKSLVVFLVGALLVGFLVAGPRRIVLNWWIIAAGAVALMIWAPNLSWQADHGWPLLELARTIAAGGSGTSDTPATFVLLQFALFGTLLVPVWAVGLWWLARDPALRAFPCAYAILGVVFLFTGGKGYYLGGLYPVLLAAGAIPVAAWMDRSAVAVRRASIAFALVVTLVASAILFLPVLPPDRIDDFGVAAVNYDAGETIGWPQMVRQVADVRDSLITDDKRSVVILASNYCEAGAIEQYGDEYGLPRPYSAHNAYWWWGPPTDGGDGPIITVGFDRDALSEVFERCDEAGRIDNGIGLANDVQGAPMLVCRGVVGSWAEVWPRLKRLG